jgi:uracil-DNA glycosylase
MRVMNTQPPSFTPVDTLSGHQPIEVRDLSAGQLSALLRFYADAGVDIVLEQTAVDRTDPVKIPASVEETVATERRTPDGRPSSAGETPSRHKPAPAPQQRDTQSLAVPDGASIEEARLAARSAQSLDELRAVVNDFTGCNLRFSAKNTVFADGNPQARIMFVGEAPGRDEDIQGLPFVGRAGQMLDRMMGAIGLTRDDVYITNMIPWRPPGNRTPTVHDVALCRPFAERHIALIAPQVLVFLGNVATKGMLDTKQGILSIRGEWVDYGLGDGRVVSAMPTLHPAYLLRNPAHKKLSWRDLLAIRARIDEGAAPG